MREIIAADPIAAVITAALDYISEKSSAEVHIGLTGGRSGNAIAHRLIAHCADNPKVHFWFSDERFVPRNDVARNDFDLPQNTRCHIHSISSSDDVASPQDAAAHYASEIHQSLTKRFCADNSLMDICILSIGPDGHIASLFPEHLALDSTLAVVAVTDSPKPPAQRVSWTYPTINASRQVWLIATGSEKSHAVSLLRAGSEFHLLPAAGVVGKDETRLYLDVEASSNP